MNNLQKYEISQFLKYAASHSDSKLNMPAPGYKKASNPDKSCGTCKHRDEKGNCKAYNFKCAKDFTCNSWQGKEDGEKEAKGRCWDGYEPVPGKKPLTAGSCRPIDGKNKKKKDDK